MANEKRIKEAAKKHVEQTQALVLPGQLSELSGRVRRQVDLGWLRQAIDAPSEVQATLKFLGALNAYASMELIERLESKPEFVTTKELLQIVNSTTSLKNEIEVALGDKEGEGTHVLDNMTKLMENADISKDSKERIFSAYASTVEARKREYVAQIDEKVQLVRAE